MTRETGGQLKDHLKDAKMVWKGAKRQQKSEGKKERKALKISVGAPLYQMGPVEQRYEYCQVNTPSLSPGFNLHTVSCVCVCVCVRVCVCVCVKGPLAEVIVLFVFHSLQPEPCKVLKHKVVILWEITEHKKKREFCYVNTCKHESHTLKEIHGQLTLFQTLWG